MLPWQFAQFVLLTQQLSLLAVYSLTLIGPAHFLSLTTSLCLALLANIILQFGNTLLLISFLPPCLISCLVSLSLSLSLSLGHRSLPLPHAPSLPSPFTLSPPSLSPSPFHKVDRVNIHVLSLPSASWFLSQALCQSTLAATQSCEHM